MKERDWEMERRQQFAREAEEQRAERLDYLRTREFVGLITDAERRELNAMLHERDGER